MEQSSSILESVRASYRGRIPTRADGIKRRRKILDAVRQVIVQSGAQGIKHRAVAEQAKVPLAATTYYFPDIHALMHDAFLDFCETNIHQLVALESQSRKLLVPFADLTFSDPEKKTVFQQSLTDLILSHIRQQVDNKDDRIIERAFRNESIRNPELAILVNAMELQQLEAIAQFFTVLQSDDPFSDSRELMALILFLEHSLLAGYVQENEAHTTLTRFFKRLLAE